MDVAASTVDISKITEYGIAFGVIFLVFRYYAPKWDGLVGAINEMTKATYNSTETVKKQQSTIEALLKAQQDTQEKLFTLVVDHSNHLNSVADKISAIEERTKKCDK